MAIAGLREIGKAAKKAVEEGVEKVEKSRAAGKPKNQRPSKKKGLIKRKPSDAKTTSKANPPAGGKKPPAGGKKPPAGGKKPPAKRSTTSPRAKRAAESRAKRTEKAVEETQKVIKPKRLTEGRAANRSKSPANKRSYKKPTLVAAGAASGAAGYSAAKKDDKKSDTKKTASSNKGTVTSTSSVKSVSKPKQSFGSAFKSARSAGKKQFTWNGKKYHTRTKEEEAKRKTKSKPKEPVVKGITYHAKQMEKKGKK